MTAGLSFKQFRLLFLKPLYIIGFENILQLVDHQEESKILRVIKLHKRYMFQLFKLSDQTSVPVDLKTDEIVQFMAQYMQRILQKRGFNKEQTQRYLQVWNAYKMRKL